MIAGTPVAQLPKAPVPGESLVRIAGDPVFHGSALHPFFNGAEKRPLPVVIRPLDGTERVIEDPPPVCHLIEFGDNSVNLQARFWIQDPDGPKGFSASNGVRADYPPY